MARLEILLEGVRDPQFSPKDYKNLELEVNFDTANSDASLTSSALTFYGNFFKRILAIKDGGLDGSSSGVYETIPVEIVVNDDIDDEISLIYGVDLSDARTVYGEDFVTVFIEKYEGIDWLDDSADAISWSLLKNEGIITELDYFKSPYLIDFEDELTKTFLFLITLYIIGTQLQQVIRDLIENIASFVPGFFTILLAIVKIFINLVMIVFIIIAIINLLKNFFETIISPVKFHNGMYVKTMFERLCEYLGLEFKSSIFDGDYSKVYHLPTKDRVGFSVLPDEDNLGYPLGGPIGDGRSFVRVFLNMFNAEIRIRNGVLRFERKGAFDALTNYTFPAIRLKSYRLNTDQFTANYDVEFLKDSSDLNTFVDGDGTYYQNVTKPQIVKDKKRQKLGGITQVKIPFALVKRKDSLSGLEKLYKKITDPLAKVANAVIKAIEEVKKVGKAIADFISKIKKVLKFVGIKLKDSKKKKPPKEKRVPFGKVETTRIGSIQMSNDFVATPRLLILDNERVPENHKNLLSAEVIYKNFHEIESLDPTKNNGKQAKIYENEVIHFCPKDFVTLLDNNGFNTVDDEKGKMLTIKWKPVQNTATVSFEIESIYTKNVKDVQLAPKFTEEVEDDPNESGRSYSSGYDESYG